MRTDFIFNIMDEAKDIGKWRYLLIIVQVPIYLFIRIFGIHNRSYERKRK